MNENNFSCIKQVTKTVRLTMPLKYTTNEIAGITEILDGWKRQFIPKLQGVVVNYRNIRLSPQPLFIHISRTAPLYNVTATFDVFCPSIGEIVKGKIIRTSREHIGCLIEGTLNATIHLSCNSTPNLSKFIRINQDILFEITRFEINRHSIRVNGRITPQCVSLMEEIFPNVPESMLNGSQDSALKLENNDGNSSSDMSCEEESFDSTSASTSKPEIPVFIKEEIQTEADEDSCDSSTRSVTKLKGSRKRKRDGESSGLSSPGTSKKRKKMKNLESEMKSEVLSEAESLASKSKKKKKKKKEKSLLHNDLTSNMLNEADAIKKEELSEAESSIAKSKKKKKQKEESAVVSDLATDMLGDGDLASKFSAFDLDSSAYSVPQIKMESSSSAAESERKGKKRKHETSSSVDDKIKKKHKSKGKKKDKKKSKDEKKVAKAKKKLLASGNILKKDKKKSKNKKHSSDKSKKKKKHSKKETNSISASVSIKSELP